MTLRYHITLPLTRCLSLSLYVMKRLTLQALSWTHYRFSQLPRSIISSRNYYLSLYCTFRWIPELFSATFRGNTHAGSFSYSSSLTDVYVSSEAHHRDKAKEHLTALARALVTYISYWNTLTTRKLKYSFR